MQAKLKKKCFVALAFLLMVDTARADGFQCFPDGRNSLHNFSAQLLDKSAEVRFSECSGKVVLVVNVASFCGLTSHYYGLNVLQERFGNKLDILGFPCNQFGYQEPGGNATEIYGIIRNVRPGGGFQPRFRLFEKVEVNGERQHPVFKFLKAMCPTDELFREKHLVDCQIFHPNDIRWNFEKFLVKPNGQPYARFPASTEPELLAPHIQNLISEMEHW